MGDVRVAYGGVEEEVVVSRAGAKGGADWVPCAKPSGGAQFCQTTCDGGFTSRGDDPLGWGMAEWRRCGRLAERARRGGPVWCSQQKLSRMDQF